MGFKALLTSRKKTTTQEVIVPGEGSREWKAEVGILKRHKMHMTLCSQGYFWEGCLVPLSFLSPYWIFMEAMNSSSYHLTSLNVSNHFMGCCEANGEEMCECISQTINWYVVVFLLLLPFLIKNKKMRESFLTSGTVFRKLWSWVRSDLDPNCSPEGLLAPLIFQGFWEDRTLTVWRAERKASPNLRKSFYVEPHKC